MNATPSTKGAWLYCTWAGDLMLLGAIKNEGSFEKLINDHCEAHGQDHRKTIHIIIEGQPNYDEIRELSPRFPFIYDSSTEVGELLGIGKELKNIRNERARNMWFEELREGDNDRPSY